MPGGARIETTKEIADGTLCPISLRHTKGFQKMVQPDHAVRRNKVGQQPFRILCSPFSSHRADNYRNGDRDILSDFSVAVLSIHVIMNPPGMDGFAQGTSFTETLGVELLNKIE
jgi:hypothetical protein